jgi:hypothetical protein
MATHSGFRSIGEVQSLDQVSQMPFDQIPTGHFSLAEYELPLSTAELSGFGAQINPLETTSTSQQIGRTSDFLNPMTAPDWFLLLSVGVVVVPDVKAFAINGASVAAPAASNTTVPQFDGTIPATGLINGVNGNANTRDATARYAQLNWGHDSMQAAWAFLHAYRMQMILTGKFVLFDELAAHVGACVGAETWEGFGNPNLGAARYVRRVNDRMAALGSTRRFIPQTTIAGDTPLGAPAPLVPAAYGGPGLDGIFGGWYPTQGILLYPGMPIQIRFTRTDNDVVYYNRLIDSLKLEDEITWDANFSDVVTPTAPATATGFSSSVPFKGGLFKLGVIMRGLSLAPKPCVDWYRMAGQIYNPENARAIYGSALQALSAQAAAAGLAGLPEMETGPLALPGPQG